MDCRLKAVIIAKSVKLPVFMLLKTYSLSLHPSKFCYRSELFENVHEAGRQSLELLLIINTTVTPPGLIPDQACTVAETAHRTPSCIRRAAGWPPELGSPAKDWGSDAETAWAKPEIFLKFRHGSFWAVFSSADSSLLEHYRPSWRVKESKPTIFLTGVWHDVFSPLPIKRQEWFASPLIRLEHSLRNRTMRINWMFHN